MRKSSAAYSRRKVLALGSASALAAALPVSAARSQAQSEAAMAEAGKKEGRVTVYSNADPAVTERLLQFFTAKYGVAADLQRLSGAALGQRFTTEAEAGTNVADLVVSIDSAFPRQALAKNWLIKTTDLPSMAAWPRQALQSGLAPVGISPYVLAWNNQMSPGRLTSFEALNDIRMRGRVAVGDPRALPSARLWFVAMLQKFDAAFFKEMGTYAAFSPSAATSLQRLAAGDVFTFAPAPLSAVTEWMERGAPVSYAVCEPVVVSQTVAAIAAKAPHPAAARLLLDYWMSQEGQGVFSRRGYTLLPGVLGSNVLQSYMDIDQDAADRDLDRIVKALGI